MAENAKNANHAKSGNSTKTSSRGASEPVSESSVDRLEGTSGDADQPMPLSGEMARQQAAFAASIEEEVDALRVDLVQDTPGRDARNGTGRIVDEVAEEQMAGMTESGPGLEDKGVLSVVPGRDNTSSILRRHHSDPETARSQDLVQSNLDEPRDEAWVDRKVDEGTAA